jgi:flagellar P-ring protein precursor FlgI
MITAELPPFAKPGQRLDITVSAMGKAKSIRGGTLLMAPLRGADGEIYAMSQGNVAVGGLGVEGSDGSKVSINIPSAGRVPGGATVERAVNAGFADTPQLVFNLADADLTTGRARRRRDQPVARQHCPRTDAVSITIDAPTGAQVRTALMSKIENLLVDRPMLRPA